MEESVNPVVIFSGQMWEAGLLKSLLENAEIQAYLKDEAIGVMAPWYTGGGGVAAVKVVVAEKDVQQAMIVVEEFQKNRE